MTLSAATIDDLLLVALLAQQKIKPEPLKKIAGQKTFAGLFSAPPKDALMSTRAAGVRLVEHGLADALGKDGERLVLTKQGVARARDYLGCHELRGPLTWGRGRNGVSLYLAHLPAKALDLSGQIDAAALKRLAEVDGLRAEILRQRFELNLRPVPGLKALRTEQDPRPLTLKAQRTPEEASLIVGLRLSRLFETAGAPANAPHEVGPIPKGVFERFRRGTTRMVLEDCLRYREWAQQLRHMPESWPRDDGPATGGTGETHGTGPITDLAQEWNDFISEPQQIPEDEDELLQVLASAISSAAEELGARNAFESKAVPDRTWLRVHHGPSVQGGRADLLIALCERNPKGGGLLNQINELKDNLDKSTTPVIVRSMPFPAGAGAQANLVMGKLVAKGGRRAVIEDIEWRSMVALEAFRKKHDGPHFTEFLAAEVPISSLSAIRDILALDDVTVVRAPAGSGSVPASQSTSARQTVSEKILENASSSSSPSVPDRAAAARGASGSLLPRGGPIVLGETIGRKPQEVLLQPEDLKRHMTFMGSTGSGKTTAALHLVESLLAQGIPAILVDRKGDLCGYRRPDVWSANLGDPERDAFRARLQSQVEVAIYTPGKASGRGLALSLIPKGTKELPVADREHVAQISGDALADMMSLGAGQKASGKRAALKVALQQLAAEEEDITIVSLGQYLQEKDGGLVADLGPLARFLGDLALDVEIFARQNRNLFGEGCEPLDAGALLGRETGGSGKTRLSIVSTKFLGSPSDELFWVAQLLLELYRWARKHPTDTLQAVVMLDEADKYLPAHGKPATKQPVEDLLRRARSMGVGVFLASQNPGDFDYRCRDNIRTWLVGLLSQRRGIEKLEELFGKNGDPSQLSSQTTGQFHLLAEGQVTRVQMRRNAVKLPSQVSDDEIVDLAARGPAQAGR